MMITRHSHALRGKGREEGRGGRQPLPPPPARQPILRPCVSEVRHSLSLRNTEGELWKKNAKKKRKRRSHCPFLAQSVFYMRIAADAR